MKLGLAYVISGAVSYTHLDVYKRQDWAREHGGKRLYISAHSAVETQAFYRGLGCIEAQEYSRKHVEKEPFDCQLEYPL